MTVGTGRDDTDVVGVLDGDDSTSGENDLLPGLADVKDVDTYRDLRFRDSVAMGWMI